MKKTGIHLLLLVAALVGPVNASAGIAICRSLYDSMQTQAALQHCLPLAEDGSGEASFILSNIYSLGVGSDEPNLEQALLWLTRSAKQGYGPGCYNLAALYERGEVLGLDFNSAFEWYKKGAEDGHAPSQSKLGTFYLRGIGTRTDFDQARLWLTKAARQGDQSAQVMLATLIGESDPQQAIDWYKEAAKQDNAYAYQQLALIYGEGRLGQQIDYDRALLFATESVRLGRLSSPSLVEQFSTEQARLRKHRDTKKPVPEPVAETETAAPEAAEASPTEQPVVVVQQEKPVLPVDTADRPDPEPETEQDKALQATATSEASDVAAATPGLRDKTWLMAQPASEYAMQLIQLTDKSAVEAFLKKNNLQGQANYYRAHTRAGKVFVVLYGETDASLTAVKGIAKQRLPEKIRGKVWFRTYRSLQQSYKPVKE